MGFHTFPIILKVVPKLFLEGYTLASAILTTNNDTTAKSKHIAQNRVKVAKNINDRILKKYFSSA